MIPDAVIEEIRDRVDVVAVIGRHMELKRSGRTWKGCCVFHGERTPSFHVYPEDKHFKCYGCGAHGDVFGFLQRLEGKEFPEVVRDLAREVGVEIPEAEEESAEQKRRRLERKEILAANDAAARYWAARLGSKFGAIGREYLDGRGVTEESVGKFRLGVAADEWKDVPRRLADKGIGTPALVKAGLVIEKEKGGVYDRFRNRLMFPIAAMDGQIIGFGGRALPGSSNDEKGAKYLNTPETPAYKKSKVLYGLDLARETIRKTRQAVLVEGYFDVIGLHQVGVSNAVAVCGTALTPEHVELLTRCDCREVTVLFDGDAAGLAAPAKAAEALFPAGVAGKVAVLPADAGKIDPDDFARAHGKAGVEGLLARAVPLSTFLIDRAVERACGATPREAPLEHKLAAVRELRPFVRMMPEGLARSVFEDAIARKLDLDVAALREELSAERPRGGGPVPQRPAPRRPVAGAAPAADPLQAARRPGPRAQKLLLPGPAADALALLAVFPALGEAAVELNLAETLPPGPLAELAQALTRGELPAEEALARLEAVADEVTVGRARSQPPEHAERELRKSLLKAKIDRIAAQLVAIGRDTVKAGTAAAAGRAEEYQRLDRMRRDLEKRLKDIVGRG